MAFNTRFPVQKAVQTGQMMLERQKKSSNGLSSVQLLTKINHSAIQNGGSCVIVGDSKIKYFLLSVIEILIPEQLETASEITLN